MEGKGAYFGTFGKFENMKTSDEYDKRPVRRNRGSEGGEEEQGGSGGGEERGDENVVIQVKKGETREFEPRNFLTSPSKKGHQGLLSCK
eukprot:767747-Hanusia_phi.AAC.2